MFLTLQPRRFQQPWTAHPFIQRVQTKEDDLDDLLTPFHILSALANSPQRNCSRKRKEPEESNEEQKVEKKSRFEWNLNVEGYGPEELEVKLVDNCLVVSGKHEHSDHNGSLSRNFTRKFMIPEEVELEELCCNLSSKDKTIQFSAPWKVKVPQIKERNIPITFTSQSSKENHKEILHSSSADEAEAVKEEDEILNKITSNDPTDAA